MSRPFQERSLTSKVGWCILAANEWYSLAAKRWYNFAANEWYTTVRKLTEGFNFSPVDAEGKILQHWCNQDELTIALWHWMGRPQEDRLGPAEPVPDDWSFLSDD